MNNEKNKAILLVRVSTDRQDFDEQERQLYELALSDGYAEENIVAICEKESGIKLKEEERRGLNQMKKVIAEGGVSCVYAWEPSRIARKKKVLFSITEYLIERKIQLITKEPYIKLLNADGSINEGGETLLTIAAQIAESEMRSRQARWKRTRIKNSREGVWNGGASIRYGYTIDENKRYIIHPEQGEVVKLVYDLYTSTNMGQTHLRNELIRRGIELSQDRIRRMLSFKGYTGLPVNSPYYINGVRYDGYDLRYPPLISLETYEKAQEKKAFANTEAYKGHNFYFCKSLLRCPACGHIYMAYRHMGQFKCQANKHDNKDIKKCDNSLSININVLETLVWDATVDEYIAARKNTKSENIKEYRKQIKTCESIIAATEVRIKKEEDKRKRLAKIFALGDLEEEDYMTGRAACEQNIADIRVDAMTAQAKIEQLQKMIEATDDKNMIDVINELSEEAFSKSELMEMSEIVHAYISKIELAESERFGKRTKEVKVTAVSGNVYQYCSRYECGGSHTHILWKRQPQLSEFIEEYREFIPTISVIRRLGRTSSKDTTRPEVTIIKNKGDYYVSPVKPKDPKSDKQAGMKAVLELAEKLKK